VSDFRPRPGLDRCERRGKRHPGARPRRDATRLSGDSCAPFGLPGNDATSGGAKAGTPSSLTLNGSCAFDLQAFDEQGNTLEAGNGFTVRSSAPSVVAACSLGFFDSEQACNAGDDAPDGEAQGSLTAVGHGDAVVTVSAAGVSTTVAVSAP
jgi:hypothetical protein